jgi:hypothetical protein
VQSKATPQRRKPQLTMERLLDRAEGFMQMKGLTASAAVRQAMPDELLAIPMDDLRTLVESALIAKLGQRRSRERYRDTEKRAQQVRQLTEDVLGRINEQVKEQAEILAKVSYVMHGVPTPLLTMSLEDHVSKRLEAQRLKVNSDGRFRFHDSAAKALEAAGVESIASLALPEITKLAAQAEKVWGESK